MTASLWTQIGYARAAGVLAERAGLHFAPNRQPAAEAAMVRVMEDVGIDDPVRFARQLAIDDELMATLLATVTIGETYFFREPAQFGYIRNHVLPTFRGQRDAARPVRVWSAGCATGEEPYTLGVMLREGGWTGSCTLLGTDVSRPRLEAARRARYTRWSLRGVAEHDIDRYFIRRGAQFQLRPQLRSMVDFRMLNLASDGWPGDGTGINDMDLILCRNVLIYFERAALAEVATRLLASLSEDGWLFMGASDPMLSDLVPCETVITGAGLAYRRRVQRALWSLSAAISSGPEPAHAAAPAVRLPRADQLPASASDDSTPPSDSWTPSLDGSSSATSVAGRRRATGDVGASAAVSRVKSAGVGNDTRTDTPHTDAMALYDRRDYAAAAAAASAAVRAAPSDSASWQLLVRALANSGEIVPAEQACMEALTWHPTSPELSYLHAVLLLQRGQYAAAAAAARRALYLDRSLAVAHLALGLALARLGHRAQAERAFRATERALDALEPDALVPLGDGEVAHHLRETARAQRRLLAEAVA